MDRVKRIVELAESPSYDYYSHVLSFTIKDKLVKLKLTAGSKHAPVTVAILRAPRGLDLLTENELSEIFTLVHDKLAKTRRAKRKEEKKLAEQELEELLQ